MIKKISLALLIGAVMQSAIAAQIPSRSPYDSRIQAINYNAANVTEIMAKTGYATVVNFGADEVIIDIASGFTNGWDIKDNNNRVFIKPVAFSNNSEVIEPNPTQWNTNLIITTNKRVYSFDLNLIPDAEKNNAYVVNFAYPQEIAKQRQIAYQKAEQERQQRLNKEAVNNDLEAMPSPKNWNYGMKVGEDSQSITPDFVYDDATRTFIGFAPEKSIPAVFYYQGEQEMMSNVTTKQQGKYTVIVLMKTAPKLILRSGKEVIGIINHGYGKYVSDGSNTSNGNVLREVK
ncbi:P-type conjugative transfer protein VirB9 [Rosenbergiella nectarea]|uniref:P-type conjugative transfer protein VirB9 n=1 Tax=Rosenbergiella nectarea TaxID=988801 RepID=UPI001F4DC489|nr:P-type conjugative transfer protein VirB9 [Rosenbergiella nectarea]